MTKRSRIQIIPLGGVGEIGKNMFAIRSGQEIIVVDAGLKFPDDEMLGIDYVIPRMDYLLENRHLVKALILTHGHEDHIGGVPYLLKQLNLPIYASALTLGLLENKLREHHLRAETTTIRNGDIVTIGKAFKVEFLLNNHSIPDSFALAITTPAGIVIHTGDFKIDQTPVESLPMDLQKLAIIGQRGVLALLCDSTNAEREGFTKSERIVGQTFDQLFREHTSERIIIATFASNIHRVQQVIDVAVKHHRRVAAVGRSMINNIDIAISLGYLRIPPGTYISIDEASKLRPHEQVIISTGSQGEPLSGLTRMAAGSHPKISISRGDLVIFSSSPIPGNESLVNRAINDLLSRDAIVIHQGNADVHVSGHASREELKLMISLIKPRFILPIHGEYRHQTAMIRMVESLGIASDRCFLAEIGDVIDLSLEGLRKVGRIEAGMTLVDGLGIGDVGNVVLRERHVLSQDGAVTLVMGYNRKRKQFISGPEILSRGFIYMREAEELIDDMRQITQGTIAECRHSGRFRIDQIKEMLEEALGSFLFERTGRRPMILPIIIEV